VGWIHFDQELAHSLYGVKSAGSTIAENLLTNSATKPFLEKPVPCRYVVVTISDISIGCWFTGYIKDCKDIKGPYNKN